MAFTRLDLRTLMQQEFKTGFAVYEFEQYVTASVDRAIRDAFPDFPEYAFSDIFGDNVTTRYALTGRSIALLPLGDMDIPNITSTAGGDSSGTLVAAPTIAPVLTATASGGSLTGPAIYFVAYSYVTNMGETVASPWARVLVPSGSTGKISVTPTASTRDSVTNIYLYASSAIGSTALTRSATVSNASSASNITSLPASTNATPLLTYTAVNTAGLDPDLEPGVGADGKVAAASTTVKFTTAPTLGMAVRLNYTRRHEPVTYDTQSINLPYDYMVDATKMNLLNLLSINAQSGDMKLYYQLFKESEAKLAQTITSSATRRATRWRGITW